MDNLTIGADVATMVTGAAALTAVITWAFGRFRFWKQERMAKQRTNWHGYVVTAGIDDWYVRLIEEPTTPTERVVLDVVDRQGDPQVNAAQMMRQRIQEDGRLCRVPTAEEWELLRFIQNERADRDGMTLGR